MTHFERTYLLNHPNIVVKYNNGLNSKDYNFTSDLQKQKEQLAIQMEYRELDRLAMELEKEIQAIKAIRMEMETYKNNFTLMIKDEATKKIQDVINGIDQIFK